MSPSESESVSRGSPFLYFLNESWTRRGPGKRRFHIWRRSVAGSFCIPVLEVVFDSLSRFTTTTEVFVVLLSLEMDPVVVSPHSAAGNVTVIVSSMMSRWFHQGSSQLNGGIEEENHGKEQRILKNIPTHYYIESEFLLRSTVNVVV